MPGEAHDTRLFVCVCHPSSLFRLTPKNFGNPSQFPNFRIAEWNFLLLNFSYRIWRHPFSNSKTFAL